MAIGKRYYADCDTCRRDREILPPRIQTKKDAVRFLREEGWTVGQKISCNWCNDQGRAGESDEARRSDSGG